MSSREKFWGVLFVAACAFVIVVSSLWLADPDVFWHLKVGEWIAEHRAVPRADVYSWSCRGEPWTCHQWLWELVIYCLYEKLGLAGLWGLVSACALAAGLALRAGLLAAGASGEVASLAAGAGVAFLAGWLKPWPQAGTYALFAAYLCLSLKGRWGRREAALAFLLAALWANLHANAALLPCLLLAEAVWRRLAREQGAAGCLLAAFAAFLGTLLNPHGPGLWLYAVREGLLTGTYRRHIAEWMPYLFVPEMAPAPLASAAVLLAAAAEHKWRSLEFARACGLWILALLSRIWTPWAVLSTAALAGRLLPRFRPLPALAVLVLAVGASALAARGAPADLDEAAARCGFPVRAAEVVMERGFEKVFNDYGFGGYLIWKGVPVYIDGRADLYRHRDVFWSYVEAPEEYPGRLSEFVERTGAEAAVVVRHGPFDRALEESPEWRRVYADGAAGVYVTANPTDWL